MTGFAVRDVPAERSWQTGSVATWRFSSSFKLKADCSDEIDDDSTIDRSHDYSSSQAGMDPQCQEGESSAGESAPQYNTTYIQQARRALLKNHR